MGLWRKSPGKWGTRRFFSKPSPIFPEDKKVYRVARKKNPNFAVINETQLKWIFGDFLRAGFWGFFYAPTRRGALPPPSFFLGTRPHRKWGFFLRAGFWVFFCAPPPPTRNWVFFCAPPCNYGPINILLGRGF